MLAFIGCPGFWTGVAVVVGAVGVLPGVTAIGWGDNAVRGYRAVSKAEADDILEHGRFRQKPDTQSMEDKWFSETREGAEQRKVMLGADEIVEADVPREVYERSHKVPNQDRTGPAFCVSCTDLNQIRPRPRE